MSSDDWFTALIAACVVIAGWIAAMFVLIYVGKGLG